MRVFVAGGTGVIGRRIVRQLVGRGHGVVVLARGTDRQELVRRLGATPVGGDLFDAASLVPAMAGCDVAIRAATSIPTKSRTRRADFAMNDRIRTEGTRAMLEAASEAKVPAYLHESIVWAVGRPDGTPYDEDAPPRPGADVRATLAGERIAREEGARRGIDVAILRCGTFYSADAAHTRTIGQRLARRALPIIGDGRALWSMVHADDAADAFVAAAEHPRTGAWHIVDDRPVSVGELFTDLAARLGAPAPRRVPTWLAMLAGGSLTVEILTTSFPTSSARFQRDFGWRPRYPTTREGFDEVLAAWREEGFPARRG
jgi:nucleoside-diphosphate-sugar epimerase